MTELIDRRLLAFLLYDWLGVDRLPERARFADHSRASFDAFIDAADQLAQREFAPHNRLSDQHEPQFVDGRVQIIPEVKRALDAFSAGGFLGAAQDAECGGLQLPVVIEKACFAHFMAANVATAAYPFLTLGNANLLLAHASPAQIDAFARPQLSGRFFGTMCLSEPHAGSSLADIATRAVADGEDAFGARYRVTGNKMWISGGEHELGSNIIHLVLAKIVADDGSLPAGARGISIFAVPRTLINGDGSLGERNDVALAGVNHKMGYRGTVNTLLNFGEGKFTPHGRAGAIGYRIGEPGEGLAIMFHMMNEARIGVGLGATMLGYAGYRYALQYARERTQGHALAESGAAASKVVRTPPVPIIRHSDVRRMLLAQKSYCEGALALNLLCARLVDDQRTAPTTGRQKEATQLLSLLTPIAKSWPSQWCLEANNLAIQVLGGYGYTRDYPVEQHWRDNRLNAIHEGTHGIQALDLLSRRVALDNGAALHALSGRIEQTVRQAARAEGANGASGAIDSDQDLARWSSALARRHARLLEVTAIIATCPSPAHALANASLYLEAFGHIVIAWLWLEQALAATRLRASNDATFALSRRQTCRYFMRYELPRVDAQLDLLAALDTTTAALDEAAL